MTRNDHSFKWLRFLFTAFVFLAQSSSEAWCGETLVHSFVRGNNDGGNPASGLVMDALGSLYGTTYEGGAKKAGTVFNLVHNSDGTWSETILYEFSGGHAPNGSHPTALVFDGWQTLYGITPWGGTPAQGSQECQEAGCGTVFALTLGSSSPTFSLIHTFTGLKVGAFPAGVTLDRKGNLYVTTNMSKGNCGNGSCGTVLKLTHTSSGWAATSIHVFGTGDGQTPSGPVSVDAGGNLFGTTQGGGASGWGTVYKISPVAGGGWTESILYSFSGGIDGSIPEGNLTLDSAGNVYGTTAGGGTGGSGTVFELMAASSGTESVLYSFAGGSDGADPLAGVSFDSSGNLYGTTYRGGNGCLGEGCGLVFKLALGSVGWVKTSLYEFTGGLDGEAPAGSVLLDSAGNLLGVAEDGGLVTSKCASGCGVVFEITP